MTPNSADDQDPLELSSSTEAAGLGGFISGFMDSVLPDGQPTQIGPYKILQILGEGGMGVVYLAEQEQPVRRRVALKLIKLGMDTKEVVARFEAERQALAMMDHPAIAKVYDAGATEDGRPYFVMEPVSGVPLTDYCDRHKLDVKKRLDLFVRVCQGVQHAHHKGIIHRDLKPSNILVGASDEEAIVKIIDFGVAKATSQRLTEKTFFTQLGHAIGTPAYMSPEQAEMSGEDIDTRTDVYSMGVILYELLVGALPFDWEAARGAAYEEFFRHIREFEPAVPSQRWSRHDGQTTSRLADRRGTTPVQFASLLRGDLDWITMKALEKDRTRRYATASELAAEVSRHLRCEPVLAGPPGVAYRAKKYFQRHKIGVVATVIVLILLVVSTSSTWLVMERRQFEEDEARSATFLEKGATELESYLAVRATLAELKERWQESERHIPLYYPIWMREREIEARQQLATARRALVQHYDQGVIKLSKADDAAPAGSSLRDRAQALLERAYFERYSEAQKKAHVVLEADSYRSLAESLERGTYAAEFEGRGTVNLSSEPPGADVYCFRYENHEELLIPLPYNPAAGLDDAAAGRRGSPFLEVERISSKNLAQGFEVGDRLLSVRRRPIAVRGDLARALVNLPLDASVDVKLRRSRKEESLSWVPFPRRVYDSHALDDIGGMTFRPGELLNIEIQLGLTFKAYPLEETAENLCGRTSADAPLKVELPRGDYLFVLRKAGHLATRFPATIPGSVEDASVRLPESASTPPGFDYVPAGTFGYGGDPEAFQGFDRGETHLADFFIGRFEVTTAEYLQFVNDPEVLKATDSEGRLTVDQKSIRIIPRFWKRAQGAWERGGWPDQAPLSGVSHLAAIEYARWRTRNDLHWKYRLPSDLEWEKAARGVDRRIYVWGNHMVWSYSWNENSRGKTRPSDVGGKVPMDESVYGVRDLAGSVREHVADRINERQDYRSIRGGGWRVPDEYFYRTATRNGLSPTGSYSDSGIRLIAERKKPND